MKGYTTTILAAFAGLAAALPASTPVIEDRAAKVSVAVAQPSSTVVGTSALGIERFSGIPYAYPPVGPLRLKPPVRLNSSLGTFDATGIEAACPQFIFSTGGNSLLTSVLGDVLNLPFFQKATKQSEDCLTINVIRPAGVKAGDKLPVLFWIFGGGFELGWTSMYDGSSLVSNAVLGGKPFVFVAVNYRVGGFGFLPGKEVLKDGAANLGLLDQRMGLEWVSDNIASFGGDPSKVTIWGESAGAISVLDQMILYDGDNKYNGRPLFRGAIMNSGSIVPAAPVDCPKSQVVYDTVVEAAGCSSAPDTLACLRAAPYSTFLNASNSVPGIVSYNSLALSYLPRPDGRVLTASPDVLIQSNKYAAVPMIIGDQEDEGTLFSLFQANTTSTTSAIVSYLSDIFFHDATQDELTTLVSTYDDSIIAGSPFRTGILNEVYPGFKRLAAILGDLVFTLTRRAFLATTTAVNPNVPSWSYLASYDYGTPILGTCHATDLLQVFYGILPNAASKSIQSYYANFVYNLDPNDSSGGTGTTGTKVGLAWPKWKDGAKLVQFFNIGSTLINDDFRSDSYDFIAANVRSFYI